MIVKFELLAKAEKSFEDFEYDVAKILLFLPQYFKRSIPGRVIANYEKEDRPRKVEFVFTGFVAISTDVDLPSNERAGLSNVFMGTVVGALKDLELATDYELSRSGASMTLHGPIINHNGSLAVAVDGEQKNAADKDQPSSRVPGFCISFCHDTTRHASLSTGIIADDAARLARHLNQNPMVLSLKNSSFKLALRPVSVVDTVRQSFTIAIANCNPQAYGLPPDFMVQCFSQTLQQYFGDTRHYFVASLGCTDDIATPLSKIKATKNSGLLATTGILDEKIPEEFLCQVTQQIMDEPIIVTRSGTYVDRRTFTLLYATNPRNPFTGEPITDIRNFVVDAVLKKKIDFFVKTMVGVCFNRDFLSSQETGVLSRFISDGTGINAEPLLDLIMSYGVSNYRAPVRLQLNSPTISADVQLGMSESKRVPSSAMTLAAVAPKAVANSILMYPFTVTDNRHLSSTESQLFNQFLKQKIIVLIELLRDHLGYVYGGKGMEYQCNPAGKITTFKISLHLKVDLDFKPDEITIKWAHAVAKLCMDKLKLNLVAIPCEVEVPSFSCAAPPAALLAVGKESILSPVRAAPSVPAASAAASMSLQPSNPQTPAYEFKALPAVPRTGMLVTASGDAHADLIRRMGLVVGEMEEALKTFSFFLKAIKVKKYGNAMRDICKINHPLTYTFVRALLSFKDRLPLEIDKQAGGKDHTAIHSAALNKDERIYDLLKGHGAKIDLLDVDGKSAAQLKEYATRVRQVATASAAPALAL